MNRFARGAAALCLTALVAVASTAHPQALTGLSGERQQISYLVGMDIGRSLAAVGPDLDYASIDRAVTHALAGGEPHASRRARRSCNPRSEEHSSELQSRANIACHLL